MYDFIWIYTFRTKLFSLRFADKGKNKLFLRDQWAISVLNELNR